MAKTLKFHLVLVNRRQLVEALCNYNRPDFVGCWNSVPSQWPIFSQSDNYAVALVKILNKREHYYLIDISYS